MTLGPRPFQGALEVCHALLATALSIFWFSDFGTLIWRNLGDMFWERPAKIVLSGEPLNSLRCDEAPHMLQCMDVHGR